MTLSEIMSKLLIYTDMKTTEYLSRFILDFLENFIDYTKKEIEYKEFINSR